MTEELIEELNKADVFLRDRANALPAPLNEYDIKALKDISNLICKTIDILEKAIIPPCQIGDTVYYIGTENAYYSDEYKCVKKGEIDEICYYGQKFIFGIKAKELAFFHLEQDRIYFTKEKALEALNRRTANENYE